MAIYLADEIHIFYNPQSKFSHFDMGVVFALDQLAGIKKKIVPILHRDDIPGAGEVGKKSGAKFILEWEHEQVSKGYPETETYDLIQQL
ncbi:MAG: hypothetical protein ACXACU_17080 [Candidatus Hodarchaeales archaeon]